MRNWESENKKYVLILKELLQKISVETTGSTIPSGPWEDGPTQLQYISARATDYFLTGCMARTREVTESIFILWKDGKLYTATSLSRQLLELWASAFYLTKAISLFKIDNDIEKLESTVNRLFEGVRSHVLMPWGEPANEKPIHVLDLIRNLKEIYPQAEIEYNNLCEAAHPNFPRFMELWFLGKEGDNWSNDTAFERGHKLLRDITGVIETCINGICSDIKSGILLCEELYINEEKGIDNA